MKKEITTILMLSCMLNLSIQLTTREHAYYSYQNPYYYQNAKAYSQPANDVVGIAVAITIIIVLGVIIGIGVVCYYCCKGIARRTSDNIEYVGNPPFNPQLAQPQNPNLFAYPQAPLPYRQSVNQPIQVGIPAYPVVPANIPSDR